MEHSPYKDEYVAHTLRLSKDLNRRMLYRAQHKYNGNVQAYLMSLVIQDVELPGLPDCNKCGFRHMGEFILEQLRKGR